MVKLNKKISKPRASSTNKQIKATKKKILKKVAPVKAATRQSKRETKRPVLVTSKKPVAKTSAAKKPVAKRPAAKKQQKIVASKQLKKHMKVVKPRKITQNKTLSKNPIQKSAKIMSPVPSPKNTKTKPESNSQPMAYACYTPDQYERYKISKLQLEDDSIQTLKNELKCNGQTMSGAKQDLINRVADGMVLGCIPRCPTCFGGRPKFDQRNGSYQCSGFHDDTDFVHCRSKFSFQELPRLPWISSKI